MRQLNHHQITPGITDLWVDVFDDAKRKVPATTAVAPDGTWLVLIDDGDPTPPGVGLNVRYGAEGYEITMVRQPMPGDGQQIEANAVELKAGSGPFPVAPDRATLLSGRITGQGLMVKLPRFATQVVSNPDGWFPWWPAAWAWFTRDERASLAAQLLALGEELTAVVLPCGPALYDEPAPNFYRPDNGFGPLDWTNGNTAIDPQFPALLAELLGYGFKGVWIFLGGDAGQAGVPIAMAQTQLLGPVLANYAQGNLHRYTVQIPGWDGVWHKPDGSGTGWNPNQIQAFSLEAIAAGAIYVGIEHAAGYVLAGEGGADYHAGGVMSLYSLILGEFDGANPYTPDTWQLLGRMITPTYVRPAQQGGDDPNPPWYLRPGNEQGFSYVYRVWEYGMYDGVRGLSPSILAAWRQVYVAYGAEAVC